jgi:hypothetical protein
MKNKLIALAVVIVAVLFIFLFRKEKTDSIETTNFSINYKANIDINYINHLSKILETFYSKVSKELKVDENGKFGLHLYSSRWAYLKKTFNYKTPFTVKSLSEIHILLDRNDSSADQLILHEVTHLILTRFLARDLESRLPSNSNFIQQEFAPWMWEAISLYEEKHFKDPKNINSLQRDKAPQLSEMADVSEGSLIYDCGYTLIEYVIAS